MNQGAVQRKRPRGGQAVYMIEGENCTTTQIAERLGISRKAATNRICSARRLEGPVTWARLAEPRR